MMFLSRTACLGTLLAGTVLSGQSTAEPVQLSARVQAGLIANDNDSDNVFPSGFLNFDEGFNLNRAELLIEKPLAGNLDPRIGPLPGPTPDGFDWGFEVDLRYGSDAGITFGLDDELGVNEGKDDLWLLPQWFLTAYLPWGEGVSVIAGSWFTSVGHEIGAPVDPPTAFYTHAYAFAYQPVKHVGVLASAKLPVDAAHGHWSIGAGLVQGWNNLQDNNDDASLIVDLRWRSSDFRTWVDLESIIGNEQSEDGISDQTRPFNAVSTRGDSLHRIFHSLTVSHRLDARRRWVANAVYGHQQGGDLVADANNPPGFLITENSEWYGVNLNYHHRLRDDLQASLRVEWLRDDDAAHALLPGGDYHAVTANLAWWPTPALRIRPELRYDVYQGDGKPFGGQVPTVFFGETDRQWIAAVDLTWFLGR